VIPYNLGGVPGDPSAPAGRGCPGSRQSATTASAAPPGAAHWVGSWSSPPIDPGAYAGLVPDDAGTGGVTVRDVVHTTLGGGTLRIRLSNVFGSAPATFADVRVAISAGGAGIVAGTSHRVRFGGQTSVTVRKGGQAVSDPVGLSVAAGQNLAVSIYAAQATGTVTGAGSLNHTNFISGPGDATTATASTAYPTKAPVWYWLGGIDVRSSDPGAGAIVALGDSITAGYASTIDANRGWVDLLADRLRAAQTQPPLAVLNAGIAGNELHAGSPCYGQSGLQRMDRDVLQQTGVREVILDEGDNDITQPREPSSASTPQCLPHRTISAAGMIADFKLAIRRLHARHLKVIGVTLSPFGRYQYWSPAIEAEREAINRWIRTTPDYDGVIDFDRVLRDPAHPAWLAPRYDSGDHLHPNNAGHAVMARAIPLSLFSD
jgi:lysophospholipase L1-like esterase